MTQEVLHIRNLGVTLSDTFAVVIERLDIAAGETLVLDAASGTGKSTVLGLIAGAIAPAAFPDLAHSIMGVEVTADADRRHFASPEKLGFVLQTNVLVPYLSLRENILLPLSVAGQPVDEDWQKHLVGALGLTGLLDRRPSQVSVGQRQRVSIARALVAKPALLLLDEPVSALDPANVTQVEHLISILSQEAGAATLLASHQAQNGAFAEAPRGDHRVFEHAGVTYSVFNDAAGQQAHKSQAGQVA